MDLVTVIVPVYNAETYIMRCVESLLQQTYNPIQIILVDDGSVDASLSICTQYARNYPNIEVYHQENQGVSVARNTGLSHTNGKWVFFVDSDDYIAPDFVKNFMAIDDFPFIGGGYTENAIGGWQYKVEYCTLTMEDYKSDLRTNFPRIPSVHVIGNRYKYSIISENHIEFDRGITCGEDLRFNVKYFSYIEKLCALDRCDYFYTIRDGSASHTFWSNRLEEERTECQVREALLGKSEEFDYIKYIHWHIALEHFYEFANKKHPESRLAEVKLKETIWDTYFRRALSWIRTNGSLDMKVEACVCQLETA